MVWGFCTWYSTFDVANHVCYWSDLEMETDPSPYLDISKAADIQPQGWPDMSNSVECHVVSLFRNDRC